MRGILNHGNTCSLNSLLQCLANSRQVVHYVQRIEDMSKSNIHDAFARVVAAYHNNDDRQPLSPSTFIRLLFTAIPSMRYGEQLDVCELWLMCCNAIAEANFTHEHLAIYHLDESTFPQVTPFIKLLIKSSRTLIAANKVCASPWIDLFQGMFICQTQCKHCNATHHTFEPYTMINVDITSSSLHTCLENYMDSETIDNWICETCSQVSTTTKNMRFWSLPRVLCIGLKRFVFHNGAYVKNSTKISVPTKMELSQGSVIGYHHVPTSQFNKYVCDLRGASIHYGGIDGGHYTAICFDKNGETYECDDDIVRHIVSADIVSEQLSHAYFIMYDVYTCQ